MLANNEGGCSKTTTAANFGAAFAERGHTALIIDTPAAFGIGDGFASCLPP